MRVFLRVYPIVFVLSTLFTSQIWAQDLNPTYVKAKILQGESFEFDFISNAPINIISEENIGGGFAETEEVELNLDYKFIYNSDPDFIGESKFIVERTSVNNRTLKVYTEVKIRVVPSLIEAVRDIAIIPSGQDQVAIDVLANDDMGIGTSQIVSTDLVSYGTAEIINNQIIFTKASGFTGQTSFNYLIEDETGYKSNGVVVVQAMDIPSMAGVSLEFITASMTPVDIIVDDPTYDIDSETILSLGSIQKSDEFALTYVPDLSDQGIETFELLNESGDIISVTIQIIDNSDPGLLVKDDLFYTSVGTPISFDPRDNDHTRDGAIVNYSKELTFDGTLFSYSPDPGFSGVKEFTYSIIDGQKEITGTIEIYVGNYLPQLDTYTFETFENTEFVFEYNAPIEDYLWSVVNEPYDGVLNVNVGSRTSVCAQAVGHRMIVYSPDQNFTGLDEFTLEYCVSNGQCKTIEVDVNVIPNSENCNCFGSDCVWAGDADNDGKVSVKDVLAIGYNYGETGNARTNASDEWYASFSEDWDFDQEEGDINNKYADANGDGIINIDDADVLNHNLNLYHSINANEVLAQKEVPLIFEGPESAVAGEEVVFDVFVGNSEFPVLDMKGIVFGVVFPADLVVPQSIKFIPSDEWIGNGSPVITAIDSYDGILEVGMARTRTVGVHGNGRVGELRLVVRVDVDGFKPGDEDLPFDITFEKALMSNSENKKFEIQAQPLQLTIENDTSIASELTKVTVYPNPSLDRITFAAPARDVIHDIRLYNIMGGLVSEQTGILSGSFELKHSLPQGVYTAAITTANGVAVEKVQVVRQ